MGIDALNNSPENQKSLLNYDRNRDGRVLLSEVMQCMFDSGELENYSEGLIIDVREAIDSEDKAIYDKDHKWQIDEKLNTIKKAKEEIVKLLDNKKRELGL